MIRLIFGGYVTVCALNVLGHIVEAEDWNLFTKPLLMPILLFYLLKRSMGHVTAEVLLLAGALVLSWMGDVALLFQHEQVYFIMGIAFFLLAQGLFVIVLGRSTYQRPKWRLYDIYPYLCILYAGILFQILLPAGVFTLPIVVYGGVILAMTLSAYLRKTVTSVKSFRYAFWGSVLFVFSDSLLAVNAFKSPIPYAGAGIMLTYCAAQYLLVVGVLRHVEDKK